MHATGKNVFVVIGWCWPLFVAVVAVILIGVVRDYSESTRTWLLLLCFAGTPVIFRSLFRQLNERWPEEVRGIVAFFFMLLIVGVELFLALCLAVVGIWCWESLAV